jgi:hypothetical protein
MGPEEVPGRQAKVNVILITVAVRQTDQFTAA